MYICTTVRMIDPVQTLTVIYGVITWGGSNTPTERNLMDYSVYFMFNTNLETPSFVLSDIFFLCLLCLRYVDRYVGIQYLEYSFLSA